MTQSTQDMLYKLLPAIYRIRDAGRGSESLHALIAVIESEFTRLEQDMDGLYDDWFIETCADWVIPYIGDLLGVTNMHSGESSGGVFSKRAYVANTLGYRRRKGTAPVLEQLAHDVTGWPAHVVEFFQLLITNQHLNHIRLHSLATVDLRKGNQMELLGGPFETATHTIELRRIASSRGKYNIPNIGLFLWRLQSYFISKSTPFRLEDNNSYHRYTFSPLGSDIPLFNRPQTETEMTHLAEEINVPGLLRRRALIDDEGKTSSLYFGMEPALQVFLGDSAEALKPGELVICNLSDWEKTGWKPACRQITGTSKVAVDPELGRLVFLNNTTDEKVRVSYTYGFSGDIGGGPYDRRQTLVAASADDAWVKSVSASDDAADFPSLDEALSERDHTKESIITITDSTTYHIPKEMKNPGNLTIQAGNKMRPTLRVDSGESGSLPVLQISGTGVSLTLSGLLIEGGIKIEPATGLKNLMIIHCTLVPGGALKSDGEPAQPALPSIAAGDKNNDLDVKIQYSITGPIKLPEEISGLSIQDSIIQSPQGNTFPAIYGSQTEGDISEPIYGPKTTLERSTIFGQAYARELSASETIFTGIVKAQRRQVGCTRFSFLPDGSKAPRRYNCQPDLALAACARIKDELPAELSDDERSAVTARVSPTFTSECYSAPSYGQLNPTCAEEITTGAEDGSEMGAFCHLKQPQRRANLKAALEEYLRFGLEAGTIDVIRNQTKSKENEHNEG